MYVNGVACDLAYSYFSSRAKNFPRTETSEPVSMKGGADNPYSPTFFPGLFPSPKNEIAYCGEKSEPFVAASGKYICIFY